MIDYSIRIFRLESESMRVHILNSGEHPKYQDSVYKEFEFNTITRLIRGGGIINDENTNLSKDIDIKDN